MSRESQVICILLAINFLLWLYLSIITINLYLDTYQYLKNQQDYEFYKKDNMLKKERYLQDASYTTISEKAQKRGFKPAQIIELH